MKTLLLLGLFAVPVAALGEHAPLPPKVMQAKTVYIENHAGSARFADRAYDELKKWGRFKVVTDPKEADLVLLLTSREYIVGSYTSGHLDESGYYSANTANTKVGRTFLTILDPISGQEFWQDSKAWGNLFTGFHSATRALIGELRKRIQEQETKN
ncbi:MAG: hypothetical protein NVS9B14_06550 [Candidatus Acidiferrum sp.]